MSAYRASPPVMHRNTPPSTAGPTAQWRIRNRAACMGLMAPRTTGWRTIPLTPSNAITTNQTSMTGPNARPIDAVPSLWTMNSASRMASAPGMTNGFSVVVTTLTPSSALSTEIAGVITPSP